MADWAVQGQGIIAIAVNRITSARDGFAYALRWKNWSYYGSGATLRPNLSHALIWHLMRALRCDGETRFFEVGYAAELGATEKQIGISQFKAGFGSVKMGRSVVEVGA